MPTRLFVAGQLQHSVRVSADIRVVENPRPPDCRFPGRLEKAVAGRARAEEGPGQQPGGSPPPGDQRSHGEPDGSPRPSNVRSSFTATGGRPGVRCPSSGNRDSRLHAVPLMDRRVDRITAVSIEAYRVETDSPRNAGGRRQKLPLTLRAGLRRQHTQ